MGFIGKLPRLRSVSGELLHLDLMRFIASVGIVFHHSHEFFSSADQRPYVIEHTMGLALFVDLFFVISGFVIAHVYHDKVNSGVGYVTFLQRRIGRLVPLHWLTLIISIAIGGLTLILHFPSKHMPSFQPQCIADTAFLLHSFLPCGNGIYFNDPTWSVSAEMVMYVIFPLIAFLGSKRPRLLPGIAALALMGVLAMELLYGGQALHEDRWTNLSAVPRAMPSFLLGAALFYSRQIVARLPAPRIVLTVATLGLIVGMMSGVPQLLLLLTIYVVAIAAVASDSNGAPSAIVRRCAPLGQLTYSIYMWHGLLILR